jgi:hypothetical protein
VRGVVDVAAGKADEGLGFWVGWLAGFSSFLPFFLSSFLPFFLSSFLPFFLSSFLPFFLSSFLPFFLSFFLFGRCVYVCVCM